jgi:hypothetical protein
VRKTPPGFTDGKLVAIRFRNELFEKKWAVESSKAGVFSPQRQSVLKNTLIICEGPIVSQQRSTWTTTPLEDAQCWAAARRPS